MRGYAAESPRRWRSVYDAGVIPVRKVPGLMLLLAACVGGWAVPAADNADVTGSWEGESKCTVPNSPCHDEHALYHFSTDQKNSAMLKLDACKIISGIPQFMGSLACEYHARHSLLTCTGNTAKQDTWEFHIAGDTMTGTLKIGPGKTLYRRIDLRRSQTKLTCP